MSFVLTTFCCCCCCCCPNKQGERIFWEVMTQRWQVLGILCLKKKKRKVKEIPEVDRVMGGNVCAE